MENAVSHYIAAFPTNVRQKLETIRSLVFELVPEVEETIKYGMPSFELKGNLVHYAGYKNHIGFYPAPSALEQFSKEISQYKNSKGAVQFPLDKDLPLDLITQMVQFRVEENLSKAKK
jgi:uncharacterized protein YdhG (YjbR/CyaY superfamily)